MISQEVLDGVERVNGMGGGGRMKVGVLDWRDSSHSILISDQIAEKNEEEEEENCLSKEEYDVIIMSDLVYWDSSSFGRELMDDLVETVHFFLTKSIEKSKKVLIISCYEKRWDASNKEIKKSDNHLQDDEGEENPGVYFERMMGERLGERVEKEGGELKCLLENEELSNLLQTRFSLTIYHF